MAMRHPRPQLMIVESYSFAGHLRVNGHMEFETKGLSLTGMRVLVLEDDQTLRTLLSDIIRTLGGNCTTFENADDALIKLLEQHGGFSLTIADHGLPGSIKGMEFLSMIQQKWPDLPCILTSGFNLDIAELNPQTVFLFKPWTLEQLLDAIDRALSLKPPMLS